MAEYSVSIVNTALAGATDVWTRLVDVTGMWGYYFMAIVGLLLLRYLLRPIFGGHVHFGAGRSDTARPSKEVSNDG